MESDIKTIKTYKAPVLNKLFRRVVRPSKVVSWESENMKISTLRTGTLGGLLPIADLWKLHPPLPSPPLHPPGVIPIQARQKSRAYCFFYTN